MSKYTTELRFICESKAGYEESQDGTLVNQIIEIACPHIFDDEFEIFDENYRLPLEKKIIKHFYTREIGYETFGLWKLKLNTKMEEIMPLYNQYYKSALLKFNPLWDIDMSRQHTNQSEGSTVSESNANRIDVNERNYGRTDNTQYNDNNVGKESGNSINVSENKNKDKYADTPQGGLEGLEADRYLTNARIIEGVNNNVNSNDVKREDNKTGNTNNVIDGNDKNNNVSTAKSDYNDVIKNTNVYIEKVAGKMGGDNYSRKLSDFRKTFLNIDMMVIKELEDLFMGLW